MKYINLNQHWEVDRVKEPNAASDVKLTADWLLNALMDGFQKTGFRNGDARRMYSTLKTKLGKIVNEGGYFLDMNPIEESFIKSGLDQAGGNPQTEPWFKIAEDAFFSATAEIPPAPVKEEKKSKTTTTTPEVAPESKEEEK